MGRRFRLAAAVGMAALSALALTWGAFLLLSDDEQRVAYEELAEEVSAGPSPRGGAAGIDWDALLSQNPAVCAWLEVANTSVSVPVVSATADDPLRWLYRDLWGQKSDTGTPWLDYRCSADGKVMVVYGHRTLYADYLFHDLSDVFSQPSFDGLGEASWQTPEGGAATFEPLCSASVDKSDEAWKRYAFAGPEEMRDWLSWACDAASAVSPERDELVGGAARVLVLVTCNGRAFHPDTRTVTVFVSQGDAK